jgi:hypothetical protein
MKIDLDGDGVPDVVAEDTNGHTIYVNLKYIIGGISAVVAVVAGVVFV